MAAYYNFLYVKKVFGGGGVGGGVGGPVQRWSDSSVFETLARGGSFNFQLPLGVGHPIL